MGSPDHTTNRSQIEEICRSCKTDTLNLCYFSGSFLENSIDKAATDRKQLSKLDPEGLAACSCPKS